MHSKSSILAVNVFMVGLNSGSMAQDSGDDTPANTVTVGEPAPDFTIEGEDGTFSLSDLRSGKTAEPSGKNAVVVFVRAHW